jgi:hypothetical protein
MVVVRNLILILALIVISNVGQSQSSGIDTDKQLETDESLGYKKSINPDQIVLVEQDDESGVLKDPYDTLGDNSRVSFLYHLNSDLKNAMALTALEFNYAFYKNGKWIEFFLERISSNFSEVSENHTNSASNTSAEVNFQRVPEDGQTIIGFGGGLGYRSTWIQELIKSENLFTTTSFALGIFQLNDSLRSLDYRGPGMKADFGLHKRSGRNTHYGLRMSYQLAQVKREAIFDGESSSERSLLLSWLSFGFDLSFYY